VTDELLLAFGLTEAVDQTKFPHLTKVFFWAGLQRGVSRDERLAEGSVNHAARTAPSVVRTARQHCRQVARLHLPVKAALKRKLRNVSIASAYAWK